MNTTTFTATPTMQAHAPAKTFTNAQNALQYAAHAARTFHVTYAAWQRSPTLRKLRTFPANHEATETTQP
jgi:hypothetical protein